MRRSASPSGSRVSSHRSMPPGLPIGKTRCGRPRASSSRDCDLLAEVQAAQHRHSAYRPVSDRTRDMTGSSADERELLDVAREAADAAATELRARFGEHAHGVRTKSTPTDLVSDADAVRARQADVLARVLPRVADVRRVGAAALDLAWCACGRFDAYYERGLHPWDVAAGALIAERAGLVVRPLAEAGSDPAGVVAAPPGLIDELYELVVGPA